MARNNRIFYATQAIALKPQNDTGSNQYTTWYYPRGVQSAGITTNFTLEQVFQLGQIELYENVEDVPEVEVSLNKVIDGTPPLYLMCMGGSTGITGAVKKELPAVANNRVNFRLGIYPDTNSAATGTPSVFVDCSGMYLSSVSFTIPVDGNATEDVTLVGNNKYWNSGSLYAANSSAASGFFSSNSDAGTMTAPAIGRRYKFNSSLSTIPTGNGGGIPIPEGRTMPFLQSVTVSTDLGREAINELGAMAPYYRYVTFPVEVTSEFEIIASSGDYVEAKDFDGQVGCNVVYKNLQDKTVKVVVCGSGTSDQLILDLGSKNKLTSVNYTGGEAGGDNATITYSYQTFNKFVVDASGTFAEGKWVDIVNDAEITGD
jgi:hypothetical protein